MKARPYLIAAGGTGGHMFPATALARELLARGASVMMLTDRRGARYLGPDLPHALIRAGSPSGSLGARLRGVFALAIGTVQSWRVVGRVRPPAAACFGGYASAPAAFAARLRRVPLLVHEQNAVFGRANRLAARFARTIALSFAGTAAVPAGDAEIVVTGNPVRPDFALPEAPAATGNRRRLLVLGGSQGARILSDVVPQAVMALPDHLRRQIVVAQQCRPEDLERVREAYRSSDVEVELASFFEDVPARMAAADLLITRSGASTVAEILSAGRASILVPYLYAADDHQRANADALARSGAAIVVAQGELTPHRLAGHLKAVLEDPERLAAMARSAKGMATPGAAAALADALERLTPKEATP